MTVDVHLAMRVDDFFLRHHAALARQGAVVGGKPYYRLETRLPGGARSRVSVYLGLDGPLVVTARSRLAEVQRPLRDQRQWAKLYRHAGRGARAARVRFNEELSKIGLYLKGSEIRGGGHGTLATLLAANLAGTSSAKTESLE